MAIPEASKVCCWYAKQQINSSAAFQEMLQEACENFQGNAIMRQLQVCSTASSAVSHWAVSLAAVTKGTKVDTYVHLQD